VCVVAIVAAALFVLAGAWVLGQYAKPPQSGGWVSPQVNTALYGGGVSASVRYSSVGSTSVAMPSEVRYASWTSGALPSEIRMGFASLGPLHPSGPLAYIPPPGPSYLSKPAAAPPAAIGGAAYSNASIRYSTPLAAPSSAYVAPKSVAPQQVSPALVSGGRSTAGRSTVVPSAAQFATVADRGEFNSRARQSPT
jgi:hypothetical protein